MYTSFPSVTPTTVKFPISRDPPEGGTIRNCDYAHATLYIRFQFLGIPPKGELSYEQAVSILNTHRFQFLGIPPKGEHQNLQKQILYFTKSCFQFLGIPPKGELFLTQPRGQAACPVSNF